MKSLIVEKTSGVVLFETVQQLLFRQATSVGGSTIVTSDVAATNGLIHLVDQVPDLRRTFCLTVDVPFVLSRLFLSSGSDTRQEAE